MRELFLDYFSRGFADFCEEVLVGEGGDPGFVVPHGDGIFGIEEWHFREQIFLHGAGQSGGHGLEQGERQAFVFRDVQKNIGGTKEWLHIRLPRDALDDF